MTFTKSPYGPIAKATPTDVQQPNSPAQRAVTNRMRLVGAFWKSLSVSQREAWGAAALLVRHVSADSKVTFRPSGYQLWSSYTNVWLQAHGDVGTPPSAPPSGEYDAPAFLLSAQCLPNAVLFVGEATPAGTVVQFELQPLKSASRKPAKDGYRVAGFAALESGDGNEFELVVPPGAYAARYAFVNLSDGRRTSFVEIPVAGVALSLEEGGTGTAARPQKEGSARRKAA